MADNFEEYKEGLDSPASNAAAVTPHDSTDLANTTRALFVGGAGNISVEMAGGQSAVVLTGVVAGTILPLRVTRVNSTSTTATNITAIW
jgi:hypothetical protein